MAAGGHVTGEASEGRFADLVRRAGGVLDANWLGASTKPAPRLYPHQWSWDSAFIAIGNAHRRPDRAMLELRTLFEAQWSDGRVPHIVFDDGAGDYYPSAVDWDSRSCPAAPGHLATSGICQPPIHALAVEHVVAAAPSERFAAEMYPRLCAWHDHLFRERTVGSDLVEVWHPWETGMDNSPAWDRVLAGITPAPTDVPAYRRVDTDLTDPDDRPGDGDYDRYTFLMHRLRAERYAPAEPATHPFRIRDVLFNALLVRSERSLATIARGLGHDGDAHEARAIALAAAIDEELWSERLGTYRAVDATTGEHCGASVAGDHVVLLADPPAERRDRMVDSLRRDFLVPADGPTPVVPTVPIDRPAFEPTRYWRGPCWINIAWLVAEGLARSGETALADRVRAGLLALVAGSGCFEYFDPVTRRGRGSPDFAWTAALAVDAATRTGEA